LLKSKTTVPMPVWVFGIFLLVGIFNLLIFLAYGWGALSPGSPIRPMSGEAVLGLHIQLFEVVLTSISIGLAVFGFVGYAAIKDAAERRAEETTRSMLSAYQTKQPELSQEADLRGLPTSSPQATNKPEDPKL
jgi:hypothetical protein